MPNRTDVVRFTIDQSISLVADQFEVTLSSSQPFVSRATINLATIKSGLVDALGASKLIEHITAGVIDEVELAGGPSHMEATVRGRDASAHLLDTIIRVNYGGPIKDPADIDALPPSLVAIEGVTTAIEQPGVWLASAVVRDLARRVGLDAVYMAPDYKLRDVITNDGPIIGAIQNILAPFCQFEPSRVDVWVDGTTLMVRPRPGVGGGAGAAGTPVPGFFNTIEARDARITNLQLRSSTLGMTRVMRLTGAPEPGEQDACDNIVETSTENIGYDAAGAVQTRVVERTTTRVPLGHVLKIYSETYTTTPPNLAASGTYSRTAPGSGSTTRLTKTTKQTNNWDRPFYDENCNILNSPLEHSQLIETSAWDNTAKSLQPTEQQKVTFQYDGDDFKTMQTTDKFTYNKSKKRFDAASRTITRFMPTGILEYSAVTDVYGISAGAWSHQSRSTAPAGGHRPGGKGRKIPSNLNERPPIYIAELVVDDPLASDFKYANKNLEMPNLEIIAQQCRDASGAEELEISFTAANIPWLRRGQMIQITNLDDESGADIPLPPMLIFENKLEYDGGASPKYTSTVRAVAWVAAA